MSQNILMNMVGFKLDSQNKVVEYLPKNEQYSSVIKRRAIFFNLYNYYVEKEMRLTKIEIKNGANIYEVFQNKIKSLACYTLAQPLLLKVKQNNFKFTKGCNNKVEKKLKLHKKFLQLLSKKELLFDLDDMFLHLVYERAKKVNHTAEVHLLEKSILIVDQRDDVSSTLLIPTYMKLERENMHTNRTIKAQMDEACTNINESEKIKQVYLIYPKHPKFTKYILVDLHDKVHVSESEYRVKMIPYSFSFCTKSNRSKQNQKT